MAVNKRKILESAQKFLQKGALDKASKEYQTLLELDPRDSGARLKLGDIHLRLGKKDEAVAAYLKVAHQFMKDGFDAKAVALFKQIAKLAPEQIEIYVPLAELYQRLGLTSEAMAALQTATEAFQKAGRKREALELLRKAASLDPSNTTSRLKIADLLRQQGMTAEALNEYDEVAVELERSGEEEALVAVYERVLEIEPDRLAALLGLGRALLRTAESERALELAERAARAHPELIEALELHAEALQALGRDMDESGLRRLAELHRARGDEGRAREILQRLPPAYELTLGGVDAPELRRHEPAPPRTVPAPDVDVLEDLTQAGAKLGLPAAAAPAPAAPVTVPERAPAAPRPERGVPAKPDSDAEQLLAEAGVYLRFGKRDKAIASLEAVLARNPDHTAAREKLASVLAEDSPPTDARPEDDTPRTPAAAPRPTAAGAPALRETEPEIEFEVDLDLSEEEAPESPPAPDPMGSSRPEPELGSLGDELDLGAAGSELPADLEVPSEDELAASFGAMPELEPARESGSERAPSLEPAPGRELESEPEQESARVDLGVRDEPEGAKTPSVPISPKQILEDLEEADFFQQQGLLDEAESVYRRVLEIAPTNPQALLRLGEIAAARGRDPAGETTGTGHALPPEAVTRERVELGTDAEMTLGDDLADWDTAADTGAPEGDPNEITAAAGALGSSFQESGIDAPDLEATELVAGDTAGDAAEPTGEGASVPGILETGAGDADGTERVSHSDPRENSLFDLAAELSEALDGEAEPDGEVAAPLAPDAEESLQAIFSEFKRGVRKTLTAADHETHYDLGIAYREMGLLDDAMGEFQIALESPARHLDCLQLLGLCARELKRPDDAIAFFQQALSTPDLSDERRAAIGFELGVSFDESGNADAALAALEEASRLAPDFPGLSERIDAIRALHPVVTSAGGEAPQPAPPAAPVEVFESFDDLIADAEAVIANGGDSEAACDEAPDAGSHDPSSPDDEPPPAPPRATPRRRKISFG